MDWKQFVSSLVASLAWPVAAVSILCLFKKEVAKHLPLLQKLKLPGGIEAEFNKDLAKVAAAIESAPAEINAAPNAPPELGQPAEPVVAPSTSVNILDFIVAEEDPVALRANPTGVVMEAWKALDAVLRLASNRVKNNVYVSSRVTFHGVLQYLAEVNFLTSEEVSNLRQLKKMRDLAAHTQEPISAASANEFAELAGRLAHNLTVRIDQMYPVAS